jgi:tRNA U34 5-methylaminomethyl-2-thiouridine-forming methyltransferase MnmC
MQIKIITTEDGSHTLFNEDLNEHFHSTHGAINESKHVFIDAGYKAIKPKHSYNILEIGYGTGLNALLTLHEVLNTCVKINYVAIEAYPVVNALYSKLNYIDLIGDKSLEKHYKELNECSWNYPILF